MSQTHDVSDIQSVKSDIVLLIQSHIKRYIDYINLLPSITYNKVKLTYSSIGAFDVSTKNLNDKNNKIRENIIGMILNKKVPLVYLQYSRRWARMERAISEYIKKVVNQQNAGLIIESIVCIHKGGRKNKKDFDIVVNGNMLYNIELKFNASTLTETPQFVSPMKPSKYLSNSYEDYYYDTYLIPLSAKYKLDLPTKKEYMSQIHSTSPACMKEYQSKYYSGCNRSSQSSGDRYDILFYEECKRVSKQSIFEFINMTDLDIIKMSSYLKETQVNKIYMLYKNNMFHVEYTNIDEFDIKECVKSPKTSSYIATTTTNKRIKILLRWKNGNGIAFPAFQLS